MNVAEATGGHHPKYVTAAVTLGAIVMTLDITIIQLGLPKIAGEFAASLSTLQWIFSGYTLAFASLLLAAFAALGPVVGGALVNSLGMFLLGAGIITAGFVVRSDSWQALIPAWLTMGAGSGLMTPHMMDLAVSAVPAERAGMASGTANTFFPLGTATGVAAISAYLAWRMGSVVDAEVARVAISGNGALIDQFPTVMRGQVQGHFAQYMAERFWIFGVLTAGSALVIYRLIRTSDTAMTKRGE